MSGLKVDLRTPCRWTLPALRMSSVLLLAASGGWFALGAGPVGGEAATDSLADSLVAPPADPPADPLVEPQADPLTGDARAWSTDATFPLGPLFTWLEAAAAPGARLVSLDVQARPRQVVLELRADGAASVALYVNSLSEASGPAARWVLKSIRADAGQGGVTATVEGNL